MKKHTKRIVIWIVVLAFVIPSLVWGCALTKNLVLTKMHENEIETMQFAESEEELPQFDWYRVTAYSDTKIEIYFVNIMGKGMDREYKIGGKMICTKAADGWHHTDMVNSISWSGAGSADAYIWPYWPHIFLV